MNKFSRKSVLITAAILALFVSSYTIFYKVNIYEQTAPEQGTNLSAPDYVEAATLTSEGSYMILSYDDSPISPKNSTSLEEVIKEAEAARKKAAAVSSTPAIKISSTPKLASRGSNTSKTKAEVKSQSVKLSSKGPEIVSAAKKHLGKPYEYGGSGPSSFDCSGLTMYVFNKFGVSLPHSAREQSGHGKYVPKSQLQPGDLVFFTTNGTGNISHTGIYAGGGKFIHAPESGKNVSITSMSGGYYASRYITARRLVF